jgi:hypothetical protein
VGRHHRWRRLRAPGTYWPGLITAGSYWWKGEGWSFWSVRKAKRAVIITLRNERYRRLILEVEHPDAVVAMIEAALLANTTPIR